MGVSIGGDGGYAFALSAPAPVPINQYVPGEIATLTLIGEVAFKGLLVYAEDAVGNRVGSFSSFNLLNYRLLTICNGPTDGTLTHNSALLKAPAQSFSWRAPPVAAGPLTFRAIVLRGFNDYYVIQTAPITPYVQPLFADSFEP